MIADEDICVRRDGTRCSCADSDAHMRLATKGSRVSEDTVRRYGLKAGAVAPPVSEPDPSEGKALSGPPETKALSGPDATKGRRSKA